MLALDDNDYPKHLWAFVLGTGGGTSWTSRRTSRHRYTARRRALLIQRRSSTAAAPLAVKPCESWPERARGYHRRTYRQTACGPADLAHLFDHKEHGNRWRDELDLPPHTDEPAPLYGLFTSAANSVYAPGAFLRPTDFSPRLRSLIQRRALQLYGGICRVVPSPLAVKPCEDPSWALDNFRWSAPVGGMDHVPDFLAFRRERTGELIDKRHAALRIDGSQ